MKRHIPLKDQRYPSSQSGVVTLAGLVFVLLLNDVVLKDAFHNYLTGKLSDIAGLGALALFGCLFIPRYAAVVLTGIGSAFVWWKSPFSGAFIDFVNQYSPFSIGRVIDPSDLIALAVLPLLYLLSVRGRLSPWRPRKIWEFVTIVVSVFAFVATGDTLPTNVAYNIEYPFTMSVDSLKSSIRTLTGPTRLVQESGPFFSIDIPWRCSFGLQAETRALPRGQASSLWLDRLSAACERRGWSDRELQKLFEDSVILRLRAGES